MFTPFCANSRDYFVWNFQEGNSLWNAQTSPSGTDIYTRIKVTEIILFLHSDVNIKRSPWPVSMFFPIVLLPHDGWFNNCIYVQVFLKRRMVSVNDVQVSDVIRVFHRYMWWASCRNPPNVIALGSHRAVSKITRLASLLEVRPLANFGWRQFV